MSDPNSTDGVIRLATRASALAMWQAHHVRDLLRQAAPDFDVQLIEVSTVGDRDRQSRLAEMGGQGVFTREVQAAVLDGRADIAVHSLKDLPTQSAEGLVLAGVPPRGPRFDLLVLPAGSTLSGVDDLPEGATIGTGSLRRQAQLRHHRSDLVMQEIRGNVETRLRKLEEGEYDAIVLAEAGLVRLNLADRPTVRLTPPLMLPAVGQAALGLECRTDDERTRSVLARITDRVGLAEVTAERACLRTLRAGCHAPVGALTEAVDERLTLRAVVLSADGSRRVESSCSASLDEAEQIGQAVARQLIDSGADELLAPSR